MIIPCLLVVLIYWNKWKRKSKLVLHLFKFVILPFHSVEENVLVCRNFTLWHWLDHFVLTVHAFYLYECKWSNRSFLFDNYFTSHQCLLILCVDSYDDKDVTLKILQKLKLENFQVCFFGPMHTAVHKTLGV